MTLRSADAQLKSAEAQVRQSQAALRMHEVKLHTVIRAPIDGDLTSRLVDVGQTVAASFQAPERLVIAGGPDQDAGRREHRRVGRPAAPGRISG